MLLIASFWYCGYRCIDLCYTTVFMATEKNIIIYNNNVYQCGGWLAGEINGMREYWEKTLSLSIDGKPRMCVWKRARLKTMYVCVRYMFHFVVAVDYRSMRVDRASLNSTNWFRHWAVRVALSIQLICIWAWIKCSFKSLLYSYN